MPFSHLKPERIKDIKTAFGKTDKAYDDETRTLMMDGIAPEYVQRLPKFSSPFNQLAGDLNRLNSLAKLKNGQVPLELWLTKAVDDIFAGLQQVTDFEQALTEIRVGPAEPSDTDIIVEGIEALVDLIKTKPGAYSAVIDYRKTFETALWEIDVIASYKLMHDGLHKVQLNWPETRVVTVFLSDPGMKDTLRNYSAALNQTNDDLLDAYEKGYVDGAEKIWIDELKKDQTQLEYFLGTDQPEPINEAFNSIKGLLTTQLSKLNTRLKAAINKLHLEELIKAMNEVCDALTTISPENTAQQIQQYKLGVEELTKLDGRLRELISQHDDWQGTDTLLRTLGDTLKTSSGQGQLRTAVQESERLANLKFIKSIIEIKVGPLLIGKTSFWSKRLLDSAQRFSAEVDKSNTDRSEQAFDTYRQEAWHFFFEIDSDMGDRCEELRLIGQKLRKVNDQLKFNEELDI